jgi:RNA polymerase I-specific transcription initiation factor RRN3
MALGESESSSMTNTADTAVPAAAPQQMMSLPPLVLPPTSTLEPVETFVLASIQNQTSPGYRALLDCLRKRQDPPMLLKVLLALRTSALTLLTSNNKTHAHLMHLLFRLDPFDPSSKAADIACYTDLSLATALLHLLVAIVSANSIFVTPAMSCVWKLLSHHGTGEVIRVEEPRPQLLHSCLATMVRLCPKAQTDVVMTLVATNFPFRTNPKPVLDSYARNMLHVLLYMPSLEHPMLALLIDKSLEMDVEIKIDNEGEATVERNTDNDDDIFELEMDTPVKNNNSKNKNGDDIPVDEMADKLDALMLLLLDYISRNIPTSANKADRLFRMLLPIFESNILTTHKSKFVQFLLFCICGLDPHASDDTCHTQLYRDFCELLIQILYNPYKATVTRQTAACYLASFVSRANYVCPETICEGISALLKWAEAYMQVTTITGGTDVRLQCQQHSLFYTVSQAACYIMCFRGRQAMQYYESAKAYWKEHANEEDAPYPEMLYIDLSNERWVQLCGHDLKPLLFCLESVREEFLHVASVFSIFDPPLLRTLAVDAKRMATKSRPRGSVLVTKATLAKQRMKQGVGGLGRGSNPLDSFFPFDPYLLRRSHPFVEPLYQYWEGSIEAEDTWIDVDDGDAEEALSISSDDDDDESDDDDDETQSNYNQHMATSVESAAYLHSVTSSYSTKSSLPRSHNDQRFPMEAWTSTLKRGRAPSIAETGSW